MRSAAIIAAMLALTGCAAAANPVVPLIAGGMTYSVLRDWTAPKVNRCIDLGLDYCHAWMMVRE